MNAPHEVRRERAWLAIGALVGVIVAGAIIAVLVIMGNKGGTPPARQLPATTASASGAVAGAPVGTTRDDSLRIAEEAAPALNTLDYKTLQQGLDRWEALATAPLLDELKSKRAGLASTVEKAKTASTAKVLAAAVSKVSLDASSADVLVLVEVKTTDAKNASTVKQLRQRLTVAQTAQGWKISAIATIEPAG
jgi:hypothetical protein